MTPSDPNEQAPAASNDSQQPLSAQTSENSAQPSGEQADNRSETTRRRILIGSQRDPAAYRARRHRDWKPIVESEGDETTLPGPATEPAVDSTPPQKKKKKKTSRPVKDQTLIQSMVPQEKTETPAFIPETVLKELIDEPAQLPALPEENMPAVTPGRFPPPNIRQRLGPDLEAEFAEALGSASMDELLSSGDGSTIQEQLEADSKHRARIIAVRKDDVFVELGSREQGVVPLQQFKTAPVAGGMIEVIVHRFNPDDGLYELILPGTAVHVEDWSDLSEGALVEARVTGHNNGGLECEVNHIRGFIPVSQVSLYRVEDLSEFVGQHFTCLVTEANPDQQNLVLSRRAVLEREKEEARQKMLASLRPGQIHEGLVRKLMDFGAFVDIGGVDGLLHVSQLAWGRVKHPSEVLSEGQKIQVRIEKIDPATGKISFAYRDLLESPWTAAAQKYPPNGIVRGKVTKLMEFGAFVELEPGVEGLIHISQLSHKRVWRTAEIVKEGQEVEVLVLSVDQNSQRISLSIKALSQPDPTKKEKENQAAQPEPAPAASASSKRKKPAKPLHGGLGKSTGSGFGLKW